MDIITKFFLLVDLNFLHLYEFQRINGIGFILQNKNVNKYDMTKIKRLFLVFEDLNYTLYVVWRIFIMQKFFFQ